MNFTKKDLIYFSFFLILFLLFKNSPEKMSNTDIKKIIQAEYKIDVDAIRNLSKLANDLTNNGKLRVPGGLEIDGKLTVKDVSNFKKLVTIENAELQVTHKNKGTTHFNHQNKGTNYIRGTNLSIDTSDTNISSKLVNMTKGELRIKNGKNGTTHFNYLNRGTNYIRGTNLSIDTSNTQITKGNFIIDNKKVHMKNIELRIRNGKNGTTHFNYLNRGTNYIRGGQLNIDTNGLMVQNGASFGTKTGRPLKIIPSSWGNEVTYIGFFKGKKRTGYFMMR